MAQTSAMQVENLDKVLAKLDGKRMKRPVEQYMVRELMQEGGQSLATFLAPNFPITASSVHTDFKETSLGATATILAQRHPYVFHERGSQYPVAGRTHRRRRGVKTSALRTRPRRYLARTRRVIRQQLPAKRDAAIKHIEREWAE